MSTGYSLVMAPERRNRAGAAVLGLALLAIGAGIALAGTGMLAAARSQIDRGHGFDSGPARLAFADGTGKVMPSPRIEVPNLVPGTTARGTPVAIWNNGTIAATYTVSSETPQSSGGSFLDDVLTVSVSDQTGAVVYTGKLSGLAFGGPMLEPGDSRTYVISISWPLGAGDGDHRQGHSLSFDLHGVAEPVDR